MNFKKQKRKVGGSNLRMDEDNLMFVFYDS